MNKTDHPTLKKDSLKGLSRQQQSARRREAILAAAFTEFTGKGFGAARTEDIARRAGVAKGSIYLHFADKEALLEELIKEYILPLVPRFKPAAAGAGPVKSILLGMFLPLTRLVTRGEAGHILHLIISEGPRFPRLSEIYFQTIITPGLATLQKVIARGVKSGEIQDKRLAECPQLLAAPLLTGLVWHKLFAPYKHLDMEKMLAVSLDSLLAGHKEEERHE